MLFQPFGFSENSLFLAKSSICRIIDSPEIAASRVASIPIGAYRRYVGIAFSEKQEGIIVEQFTPRLIYWDNKKDTDFFSIYRWPMANKKPQGIVYCFGKWLVSARDDGFSEFLYHLEFSFNTGLSISEVALPIEVNLMGNSTILAIKDFLLIYDNILNFLYWLDSELRLVKLTEFSSGIIIGPSYKNSAILCQSCEKKSKISLIAGANNIKPITDWFFSPWTDLQGLAQLSSGMLVAIDKDKIYFSKLDFIEWKTLEIPWPTLLLDDIKEYEIMNCQADCPTPGLT